MSIELLKVIRIAQAEKETSFIHLSISVVTSAMSSTTDEKTK